MPNIPPAPRSPNLEGNLSFFTGRWRDHTEAERRVKLNAFIQGVMEFLPTPNGFWDNLQISAELWINGVAHIGPNNPGPQVGNGRLDYLISRPIVGVGAGANLTTMRPGVIIEAKASLAGNGRGLNLDDGEWQLCAEMAAARHLAPGPALGVVHRRIRGILTDGQHWRFYELFTPPPVGPGVAPQLFRTPAIDVTAAPVHLHNVIRLLHKFILNCQQVAPIF